MSSCYIPHFLYVRETNISETTYPIYHSNQRVGSEREHVSNGFSYNSFFRESEMLYSVTGGTADVTAANDPVVNWDVAFGYRDTISNIISLDPGETKITMI